MAKISAGLLLFRRAANGPQVLLAHFGGPFFAGKDANAWGIPKGEVEEGEEPLGAARREFTEETGFAVPAAAPIPLGTVQQKSGKVVHAWAVEGDADPAKLVSNTFELEWPRGSGKVRVFPEVDRAEWFDLPTAKGKIIAAQVALLDRLVAILE